VSDVSRVKPLGPPTEKTDEGRQGIVAALQDLAAHYQMTHLMELPGLNGQGNTKAEVRKVYQAQLTDDAWIRYNRLEHELLQAGLATEYLADVLTPTYDRLAKSILKASVLLAASVQRNEEVVVTEDHILRAMAYGEEWKKFADDVITNVGRSSDEQQLDKLINTLKLHPNGMTKSKLMQWHHLNARQASQLIDTLEQRGTIITRKSGRGQLLLLTDYGANIA
jgi:predicted transcriptional regulator